MNGSAAVTGYAARLSRRRIAWTTAGVLASMFLAAVDSTVVATAMPTVVTELGGISRYAWVFSAYLVAEVAVIPLWGRLADMAGRKRVLMAGMAIFLLGSALSGLSSSMTQLIVFRAVQGIGAGCLLPVAQTVFGDLFTIEQRVRMSALFSSVFALASIVGPLLGGFITDHVDWRWVFYVNLPIGIAAIVVLEIAMVEPIEGRSRHALDWPGAVLVLLASGLLLYALEAGGRDHPWLSPLILGCLAASVVSGVLFVWQERRAAEPLLPLDLFNLRVLRPVVIVTALLSMPMFGVVSYLPLFAQVVIGTNATSAGQILTPLMFSTIVSSYVSARLILGIGYRRVVFGGAAVTLAGLWLLTRLDVAATRLDITFSMILIGLGMGAAFMVAILVAQNSVGMQQRGTTSSLVTFVRQLGGAVGVAIAGSIMISELTTRIEAAFGVDASPADLLAPRGDRPELPPEMMDLVRGAFAGALHRAFVACFVIGLVSAVAAVLVPRGRPDELHADVEEL